MNRLTALYRKSIAAFKCECKLRHYLLCVLTLVLCLSAIVAVAKGEYEAQRERMGQGELQVRFGNLKSGLQTAQSDLDKVENKLVEVQKTNAKQSLTINYLKSGLLLCLGSILTLIIEVMSGVIRQKIGIADQDE